MQKRHQKREGTILFYFPATPLAPVYITPQSPPSLPASIELEVETDLHRLGQRRKQIAFGMVAPGYIHCWATEKRWWLEKMKPSIDEAQALTKTKCASDSPQSELQEPCVVPPWEQKPMQGMPSPLKGKKIGFVFFNDSACCM